MRSGILGAGLCVAVGFVALSASAQSPSKTHEERLTALERRVEQLEQENQELKAQIARVLPEPASGGVQVAAATAAAAGTILTRPEEPPAAVPPHPSQAHLEKPKPERIELGGQIRFRGEVRQNYDLDRRLGDLQDFVGERVRLHIRGKVSDTVETFFEFQDSRLWGQEIATTSNDNLMDLHQGYLEVKDFLKSGLGLRAGRQEFIYGSERLIGAFGWDNIGRSFDALKTSYTGKTWWSDGFVAKLVDRRNTARGERDQYLYGIYNQFFRERPQHLEVYGLLFRDGLRTPGEIAARGRKATEIMTVGLRTDGKINPGFNYELEFADQFGHRGDDSHSARALAAKFYKTVEETHQVRLGFEYDVATGDRDPRDGRSGEFFNLFPTNHPHYGYADLMGWRNMQDFRPMFTVSPARRVKFDLDYHRLYLLEERGPWKSAGGAVLGLDPAGRSGTHVGDELDLTLAFPLHKHLKILSGYSLFFPGEFARKTRGEDKQHFFYLQTLVDF